MMTSLLVTNQNTLFETIKTIYFCDVFGPGPALINFQIGWMVPRPIFERSILTSNKRRLFAYYVMCCNLLQSILVLPDFIPCWKPENQDSLFFTMFKKTGVKDFLTCKGNKHVKCACFEMQHRLFETLFQCVIYPFAQWYRCERSNFAFCLVQDFNTKIIFSIHNVYHLKGRFARNSFFSTVIMKAEGTEEMNYITLENKYLLHDCPRVFSPTDRTEFLQWCVDTVRSERVSLCCKYLPQSWKEVVEKGKYETFPLCWCYNKNIAEKKKKKKTRPTFLLTRKRKFENAFH